MWPPDLTALKTDLRSRGEDVGALDADDDQLQQMLDAAIAKVREIRSGDFNFDDDPESDLPDPGPDLILGTLRLAGRWDVRRRSPDGMVQMSQEMGAGRVPSFDPDIDRLLGIGKYRNPVIA